MDFTWVPPLLGVLLGGLISVWVGKTAAQRHARRDALAALSVMTAIQRQDVLDGDEATNNQQDARFALLEAGVPWLYVKLLDNVTHGLLLTNRYFAMGGSSGDPLLVVWISQITHPARRHSRPLVQYARLIEAVIAEYLEQPLKGRLLGRARRYQLRQALDEVLQDNELKRMPEDPIILPDGREVPTRAKHLARTLKWPTRELFSVRDPRRAVRPPRGYWPAVANQPAQVDHDQPGDPPPEP